MDEATKYHCSLFKEYKKDNWVLFLYKDHEEWQSAVDFANNKNLNLRIKDYSELGEWLTTEPRAVACHNQFSYDLRLWRKLSGIQFDMFRDKGCRGTINDKQVDLFDTLSMSRLLYPDRPLPVGCPSKVKCPVTGKLKTVGPHGLEAWGFRVANKKVQIDDWRNQPLWNYVDRVFEDVIINELVWGELIKESQGRASPGDAQFFYKEKPSGFQQINWKNGLRRGMLADFLMCEQEEQGVCFRRKDAEKLVVVIDGMMKEIADDVEPRLPLKEMTKSQQPNFPQNPFNEKTGDISAHGWNWLEKHLGYPVNREALEFIAPPKTAFKQNGDVSKAGENYCLKHGIENPEEFGDFIRSQLNSANELKPLPDEMMEQAYQDLRDKKMPDLMVPMKIGNQDDIKKYLIQQGWIPTIWRTKDVTKDTNKKQRPDDVVDEKVREYLEDLDTSEYRDLILKNIGVSLKNWMNKEKMYKFFRRKARGLPTSPQLKDQRGALCPNLAILDGELAMKIVKWLSLRNRRSVLDPIDEDKNDTGLLNHPRLDADGKLPARSSGITNTFRRKHSICSNMPKADPSVLLGKEMRGLWTVPEGHYMVGVDGSNLEGMIAAWGAYEFDGGDYLRRMEDGDAHCYSGDTEVLTKAGWVRFDEVQPDEQVYQYNNDTGNLELVTPCEYIKARYQGDMYHFSNKGIDLLVTNEHRMVTFDVRTGKMKIDLAKNLNIRNGSRRFKTSARLDGNISLNQDEIVLMVAIQADGYMKKDTIRLEVAKKRKKDRIISALNSLGIRYTSQVGKKTTGGLDTLRISFNIPSKLKAYINQDKNFTYELMHITERSKKLFIEEVGLWDGWESEGNIYYSQATPRWESVSVVQTIASQIGINTYVCDIKVEGKDTQRRVTIRKKGTTTVGMLSVKKEVYPVDIYVYCYMVPSGLLIVRRNNRIAICGNTKNAEAYTIAAGRTVTRSAGKNTTYGIMYGAQAPKIAIMLGIEIDAAEKVINAFWDSNPGLKARREWLEKFWEATGRKYIPAFDGRKVHTRSKHSLLNAYQQSGGAVLMDLAGILLHWELVKRGWYDDGVRRVIYYHK